MPNYLFEVIGVAVLFCQMAGLRSPFSPRMVIGVPDEAGSLLSAVWKVVPCRSAKLFEELRSLLIEISGSMVFVCLVRAGGSVSTCSRAKF